MLVLMMAAIAYYILQRAIINTDEAHSLLKLALGKDIKGKISIVFYLAAMGCAYVNTWIAGSILIITALMWLVPDKRIERVIDKK